MITGNNHYIIIFEFANNSRYCTINFLQTFCKTLRIQPMTVFLISINKVYKYKTIFCSRHKT